MNWGYRLLFTFLAFGAMMGYLVYRSVGTHYELADKDYYNSELAYQQVLDGTKRANALGSTCTLQSGTDGYVLQLPSEMTGKKVTGTLWFYCDYDQQKDRRMAISTNESGSQLIPKGTLTPGNYLVKISWNAGGQSYYNEQKFRVN